MDSSPFPTDNKESTTNSTTATTASIEEKLPFTTSSAFALAISTGQLEQIALNFLIKSGIIQSSFQPFSFIFSRAAFLVFIQFLFVLVFLYVLHLLEMLQSL